MKITEDLLRSLGFTQQNPPYIWDYGYGKEYDFIRLFGSQDENNPSWRLSFRKSPMIYITDDFMGLVVLIAQMAHDRGVRNTQDQLHDALGLGRLVDAAIDRARGYWDDH